MKPVFKAITKVGIIVTDIMSTIKIYYEKYGVGPWNIWDINSEDLNAIKSGNDKKDYKYKIAQSYIGNTLWELIEPRDKKNIFYDFLMNRGEGLYNLGYIVENFDKTLEFMKEAKVKFKYGGNWFGKKFAYFDTYNDLKHMVEIYDFDDDFKLPPPSNIFPQAAKNKKFEKPVFKSVRQIGIAVLDIKKVASAYYDKYGIGPWEFYKYFYPKSKDMYYNQEELFTQKFTTAATMIGEIEQELMQPGDDYNVYSEFISRYGEGLQHISFIYNLSFDETVEFHKKMGHKIKQSGNINGAIYIYMDSFSDLKIITEPLYVPPDFIMPKSDYLYPEK